MTAADNTTNLTIQNNNIASAERISGQEIAARQAELTKRIEADRALAAQGDTSAMARLEIDLASRATLQAQSDTAALTRQREELASRTDLSAAERAAEMNRLDKEIASRSSLLDRELASSMDRAVLDANTKLDLSDAEVALNESKIRAETVVSSNNAYMAALAASMNNENIPANVRAAYQASLLAATQATVSLATSASGTAMDWNVPSSPPGTTYTNPYTGAGYYPGGTNGPPIMGGNR